MTIKEFVEDNFDVGSTSRNKTLGISGISGKDLAEFKNTIIGLDEFREVNVLNILSKPTFRTYYNGKIRPSYTMHPEREKYVITEKYIDETEFGPTFYTARNEDGTIDQLKQVRNDSTLQCDTIRIRSGTLFSETVDLYSISVSTYYDFNDIQNLGEGIYFMPTVYNSETFEPIKEIRIKINPDSQGINAVNPYEGKKILDRIHNHISEKAVIPNYCNIPTRYAINLRVSKRSLRPESTTSKEIYITNNNQKENNDINNYIFGR